MILQGIYWEFTGNLFTGNLLEIYGEFTGNLLGIEWELIVNLQRIYEEFTGNL